MQGKSTLQVLSGEFKGRKVPMPPPVHGNTNFTPSLLKKSIFSILESEVLNGKLQKENTVFVDMFAGSGQMAVEAISRGFSKAVVFEMDSKRFRDLKEFSSTLTDKITCFHKDAFRFFNRIGVESKDSVVFFLDPPYSFWTESSKLEKLCTSISENYQNSIQILQSPKSPEWIGFEKRTQGNHFLLVKGL